MTPGDGNGEMGPVHDELDLLRLGRPDGDAGEARLREFLAGLEVEFSEADDLNRSQEFAAVAARVTTALHPPASEPTPVRSFTERMRDFVTAIAGPGHRVAFGIAAILVVFGVVAAANRLPRPIQSVVADTAGAIGIDVPHPDDREQDVVDDDDRTRSTTTTPRRTAVTGDDGDDDPSDDDSSGSDGDDGVDNSGPGSVNSGRQTEEERQAEELREEQEEAEEEAREEAERAERDRLRAQQEAEDERRDAGEDAQDVAEEAEDDAEDAAEEAEEGEDASGSGSGDDD